MITQNAELKNTGRNVLDRSLWESFFDEHATLIYTIIKWICPHEETALEISADYFGKIKNTDTLSKMSAMPSAYLMRSAHSFTTERLRQKHFKPQHTDEARNLPVLELVCSENISMSEAANRLKLTLSQFKSRIQNEFTFLKTSLLGMQEPVDSVIL